MTTKVGLLEFDDIHDFATDKHALRIRCTDCGQVWIGNPALLTDEPALNSMASFHADSHQLGNAKK